MIEDPAKLTLRQSFPRPTAAGFVTDGPMRDYEAIVAAGLPAWCNGLNPNSPYANGPGRVGFGAVVGGQTVNSGDIIVADINGVVVVPHARIDAVIAGLAHIKVIRTRSKPRSRQALPIRQRSRRCWPMAAP